MSILDDKDAAAMLRELLGTCTAAVFTASSNPRALPPATLASLAGQLGFRGRRRWSATRARRSSAPASWPVRTAP